MKSGPHADYEQDKTNLTNFMRTYSHQEDGSPFYIQKLQQIANREEYTLQVFVEDLESYFQHSDLVNRIISNAKRYQRILYEVADSLMPGSQVQLPDTVQDIILKHRMRSGSSQDLPAQIKRKYDLVLSYKPDQKIPTLKLRETGAKQVGRLITVKGIVTRVSDVKPHMAVASFICEVCGNEEFKTIGGSTYLPLAECNSDACKTSNTKGSLHHQIRGSKFISYQQIRIQEPSEEVPMGQVPRQLKVYAYGTSTKKCAPGQQVYITGVFLTMPFTGYLSINAGLVHDTYLEAFTIRQIKKSYRDTILSAEMVTEMENNRGRQDMYSRLAQSIAPQIHGLEDVKKALLLLLVGGVTKQMTDGMKIRGDINVLLMGDPGVAKSQLLKHISVLAPRAVYTTGKGSSGVGLTAAVIKDTITGEMTLQGGALVLADQGICCIDEFDKMDQRDRTAIHQVMQQQTVSIAKAGITTTLNARSSILAAANPLYGRYNKHKTPHQNINLPAALLSRFDLVFLLLDTPEHASDKELAGAVTYVHQNMKAKTQTVQPLDSNYMRAYLAQAKRLDPVVPGELHQYIIQSYIEKRIEQTEVKKAGYLYVTPRTLLGIIRLAQGLARLKFNDSVEQDDIDEALRLMEASRASVNFIEENRKKVDPVSAVWRVLREECKKDEQRKARYANVLKRVIAEGYTQGHLDECVETYKKINVIISSEDGGYITLI